MQIEYQTQIRTITQSTILLKGNTTKASRGDCNSRHGEKYNYEPSIENENDAALPLLTLNVILTWQPDNAVKYHPANAVAGDMSVLQWLFACLVAGGKYENKYLFGQPQIKATARGGRSACRRRGDKGRKQLPRKIRRHRTVEVKSDEF
ncbi:hypothetical protein CEXT_468221 [Caerostris extrusa]|uniref:Uncharacterized protein n=1 Tax=Caerostris extrusa TaxID=172846 RepID=A0AAV4R5Z0_CAEEX|nr:hypothetical protein CEXT_468221 [Caerostris extrusa]